MGHVKLEGWVDKAERQEGGVGESGGLHGGVLAKGTSSVETRTQEVSPIRTHERGGRGKASSVAGTAVQGELVLDGIGQLVHNPLLSCLRGILQRREAEAS